MQTCKIQNSQNKYFNEFFIVVGVQLLFLTIVQLYVVLRLGITSTFRVMRQRRFMQYLQPTNAVETTDP